ncbi:2-hydroxyacid dehydrogenase [Asanoa ishikariensis]|uniref:Phosphoglycerate dehydrogenase n=1 Tax=Asanoa ishikariensis TaxID=137265 RepID=A0A1H3L2Q7_9ACTN|nr:D-2-hydroxyacid dehydrogenase family protein [Asanoa ishikariensis]GIF69546.1 2-hydroxyacid dehydrogenase [Asanoa ishikariensis]SDY58509.1 Phosphoglycerate dehydrogenase [Asanoa ishikariensis]
MRIAVLDDYQDAAAGSADWGALDVTFFGDHLAGEDELTNRLAPFDVLVAMRERTAFPETLLRRLPALRLLVTTGMANAAIDLAAAAVNGVTVCGTRMFQPSTSELTWGLILSLVRHIPAEDAALRAGRWQTTVGTELSGRTLGVVGLGTIGSQVAAVGRAFGMRVVAWSEHLDHPDRVDKADLFRQADIVTVHYKLSARSRNIVGAPEIALMKSGAFLVNTSRGPLVDTGALVAALEEGRLGGAAIDVYDIEPLPADDPLRRAPRTILTPHIGYVTEAGYRTAYGDAVEAIHAYAAGAPIRLL